MQCMKAVEMSMIMRTYNMAKETESELNKRQPDMGKVRTEISTMVFDLDHLIRHVKYMETLTANADP